MSRLALIPLVAVLSSLATVFYIRHTTPIYTPPSRVFSPSRLFTPPNPVSRVPSYPGAAPRVPVAPPAAARFPAYPPRADAYRPGPASYANIPRPAARPFSPVSRAVDCSGDYNVCGEGGYCCKGTCVKAVYGKIVFAADDAGDLYLCQQKGYNSVASTPDLTTQGTYEGWMPCKETYLKATNDKYEGGGSIAVVVDGWSYGSGAALKVKSQTDFSGPFEDVAYFDALNGTKPYSTMIDEYWAWPVKDADNSRAKTTNFEFVPPTCA